jgi:hypothetical protein
VTPRAVAVLALGAAVLAGGCARSIVRTQTYVSPEAGGVLPWPQDATFHVKPNPGSPNPLFDEELKRKIESRLGDEGYRVGGPEAPYAIDTSYEVIGGERTRVRYEEPLFPLSRSYLVQARHYSPHAHAMPYTTLVEESYPTYVSKLRLRVTRAGETTETGEPRTLWVAETRTESLAPDLRGEIDYLLAAAFEHFGRDTKKEREVRLTEKDGVIRAI